MVLTLLTLAACAGAPPAEPPVAAPPFDHGHLAFARVLEGAVTPEGAVRYERLREREAALDAYVEGLATAPVSTFSTQEQVAFWVNAYNAITLSVVVDAGPIGSIRELDGGEVWKTRSFQVGGESLTLDQIENERARRLTDGRVHAVLNCASKGCPPLPPEPLVAERVEAQLDVAASRWVGVNAFDVRGDTVYLSALFKWYPGDFEKWRQDAIPGANEAQTRALWFVARFGSPQDAERVTAGAYKLAWADYDWSLNQAP